VPSGASQPIRRGHSHPATPWRASCEGRLRSPPPASAWPVPWRRRSCAGCLAR